MIERNNSSTTRETGAVLLLLLGIIFASTLMVAAFVQSSMSEIRWASQDRQASQLRPHAYSALEVTLAAMAEYTLLDAPLHAPLPDWSEAIASEGIEFPEELDLSIQIRDIGDRIGIATLSDREDWEAFFDAFDLRPFNRDALIDALLDWMDEDDIARPFGAEAEYYRSRGFAVVPANGPPMTIGELENVIGFEDLWWESPGQASPLAQTLEATLSPLHSIPPNVNTAGLSVLKYLTGDDFTARDIFRFRSGPDEEAGTEDDVYFENQEDLERNGFTLARPAAFVGELYSIEIQVNSDGGRFHLSSLVSTDGGRSDTEQTQAGVSVIRHSEYYRFSSDREL